MTQYVLAHDLGTSGNKATIFSRSGQLIASTVMSYDVTYFNGNWAEQDAQDWWKAVCQSTKKLLEQTAISADQIKAVSFSGQMMGCLCVDKNGEPLRKSIIWADQRAQQQTEELEKSISQRDFYEIVGHRNSPSYGIQKLMWIRDNEPAIYERTYKVLNAKDYVVYKLTNQFYTDYTDGNGNGCFDIRNLCWSERILQAARISVDKLPTLKPSTFIAGSVTEQAAKETGLAIGTPVVLGAGDGLTASIGAGSVAVGNTYCCIGTSAWISTTSTEPYMDEQMRIFNWVHVIPGYYAPSGTMQSAGGALHWMRGALTTTGDDFEGLSFDTLYEEMEKSPAGANGVLFLPYLLGERSPRWDAFSKGTFIGLTTKVSKGDLYRSVLEGISHNLTVILDVLKEVHPIEQLLVIGGGAKSEFWQQLLADMFLCEITVPHILDEACSMGAAIIGGVAVGLYEDFSVIEDFLRINQTKQPNTETHKIYSKEKEKFNAFYEALKPVYQKLNQTT